MLDAVVLFKVKVFQQRLSTCNMMPLEACVHLIITLRQTWYLTEKHAKMSEDLRGNVSKLLEDHNGWEMHMNSFKNPFSVNVKNVSGAGARRTSRLAVKRSFARPFPKKFIH